MRSAMKVVFAASLILFSVAAFAQSAAEKEAVSVIEKYWQARHDRDFATQVSLMSDKGTLDANSDGTFFRTSPKVSAEELEAQIPGSNSTSVYYPEATELAAGVVLVRYYLEGVIESPAGTVPNYRTRVTTTLVRESGSWKVRAWHFSPLHDGGHHLTTKTDFED
ncbi:MAG: DUF4440 domain-containing protein [Acidobacteriota bacterium]|nr:DUF4440 domain-containing protein [Acidobacteriota bacterium]